MHRLKFTTWKWSLLLGNLGVWKEGKGWGNHLNAAITQLLTFQTSFLRRNWKQSNNTERHTETIIMAQKQKQKSFYVPFNKRKSDCKTAASQTQAHTTRQGPGLGLFLFISQFPCLFSFFALLVAARAEQGKWFQPKPTSCPHPPQLLHNAGSYILLTLEEASSCFWRKM